MVIAKDYGRPTIIAQELIWFCLPLPSNHIWMRGVETKALQLKNLHIQTYFASDLFQLFRSVCVILSRPPSRVQRILSRVWVSRTITSWQANRRQTWPIFWIAKSDSEHRYSRPITSIPSTSHTESMVHLNVTCEKIFHVLVMGLQSSEYTVGKNQPYDTLCKFIRQ